jgi:hypothetical protein
MAQDINQRDEEVHGARDHEGSSQMQAENQDMAFVNDTLENAESQTTPIGAVGKQKESASDRTI